MKLRHYIAVFLTIASVSIAGGAINLDSPGVAASGSGTIFGCSFASGTLTCTKFIATDSSEAVVVPSDSKIAFAGPGGVSLKYQANITGLITDSPNFYYRSAACGFTSVGWTCDTQSFSNVTSNSQNPADGTVYVGLLGAEVDAAGTVARIGSSAAANAATKLLSVCDNCSRTGAGTEILTVNKGGAVSVAAGLSDGTCTLNGASPSTCTFTTFASATCTCSVVSTVSPATSGGCNVSLASTTLTVTGINGATNVVNVHCY